jgi:hypothetical protein
VDATISDSGLVSSNAWNPDFDCNDQSHCIQKNLEGHDNHRILFAEINSEEKRGQGQKVAGTD